MLVGKLLCVCLFGMGIGGLLHQSHFVTGCQHGHPAAALQVRQRRQGYAHAVTCILTLTRSVFLSRDLLHRGLVML